MKSLNNLWYIQQRYQYLTDRVTVTKVRTSRDPYISSPVPTIVYKLTTTTAYELWYQRLMHAGNTTMKNIHKCTEGTPKLQKHDFHNCHICQEMNI